MQRSADGNHVPANFSVWPEFDVPEHRHGIAVDLAVDIEVAEYRYCAVSQRTGDAGFAEHRNDAVGVPFADGRAQNRYHRVRVLAGRQNSVTAEAEQLVLVAVRFLVQVQMMVTYGGVLLTV